MNLIKLCQAVCLAIISTLFTPAYAGYAKKSATSPGQNTKLVEINKYLKRSTVFEEHREFSKAIEEVTKAISLKPNSIYLYCRRGDLFEQLEKYSSGYRDYKRALNIVPRTSKDYYYRALSLKNLAKHPEALKNCDIAIKKGYHNQKVYKLKGKCYLKLEQYNNAIVWINKAIAVKPTLTSYIYLSRCYRKISDYKSSLKALAKAKILEPDSTIVILESAITEYRLNNIKHSKKLYLTWQKSVPTSALTYPDWKSFQYFCETEKKIDYYSEVIALSKNNNAAPIYERALLNLAISRYETTAKEMSKYLKMTKWAGKSGVMAASYAVICFRLSGKVFEADKLIGRASRMLIHRKWPRPIFLYLKSQLTEKQLLNVAVTKQKKTVAYYFIALRAIEKNKIDKAISNLQWVKKNGDPGVDEFNQAIAELDRLIRRKALQKR